MSYFVLHMQKATRVKVSAIERHVNRKNTNYGNEQIERDRSDKNYDLENKEDIKHLDKIDEIIKSQRISDRAIRKDAIVEVNTIITSDREFFNKLSEQERDRFFKESYEYMQKAVGKENIIAAVVHLDETTPHMHLSFVPMNEDGTLSAKKKVNKFFLKKLQDDFPKHLQKKGFDIERGLECSTKKHKEVSEYKAIQIKKEKKELDILSKEVNSNLKIVKAKLKTVKDYSVKLGALENVKFKKNPISGNVTLSEKEFNIIMDMAKKKVVMENEHIKLKKEVIDLREDVKKYKPDLKDRLKDSKKLVGGRNDIRKIEKEFKNMEKFIKKNNLMPAYNAFIKALSKSMGLER